MSDPATPTPRTTGGNVRWEPPSPADLQAQMPGYTIEKLLGRGGMGAVYKGVQSNLDRTVAIKILPPGVAQEDPSFAERFKNEARLMARLNNPAVVSVHDFGLTSGGLLYFAMEYVDGTDVSQMIRSQGKLPPEHALAITAHVCDALSAAHELGIVHRDIKPANVLINMKGQVKVADFGLAKVEEPGTHGLTKTGYAMGTPDFVAPEVLMLGSHIDGRADLYAVGVMLYQMLTGEVPRGAFKPATARLPGLDPRFDPIILKAMQSDREERYQSSTELRRDLDVILTVPLVRQDEPESAAIPAAQVAQTPAQRSAVQKPPQSRPGVATARPAAGGTAPDGRAKATPGLRHADTPATPKSPAPLLLGLGAVVALGIGAFVMMGGGEKAKQSGPLSPLSGTSVPPTPKAAQGTERPTTPPPVKVSQAPKPEPKPAITTKAPETAKPVTPSVPTVTATTSPLPSLPLPAPKQWIDATAAVKVAAGPHQEAVPGGWRATDLIPVATVSDTKPRNAVCRVQHRGPVFLSLRFTMGQGSYQGSLESMGKAVVRFVDYADGKYTHVTLALGAVPAGFKQDDSHVTMFAAQGDELTLWIDGQLVARATDTRLTAGPTRLRVDKGSIIEKVEYAELPDEAAVASSPSLPASSSPPPAAVPASELDQRLAALDSGFQAAVERDANTAFKASMAALDKLYLGALDRALATASKGGKLEEALALREEKQRIEKGQGVPSEVDESTQAPGKLPDTLKTLRQTYRSTTAQHEATKAKAMQPLYDKYDQALAAVQTELTKASQLDDALRVKAVREQIAATRGGAAAPPAAANGPTPTNPPSAALAGASAPPSGSTLLATKDKPFTNSLGMKFVPVPGTDVLFCIHETRKSDYAKYAAETPGTVNSWEKTGFGNPPVVPGDDHPVIMVSWEDAVAFCSWLSAKDGRKYRLPTDNEWSHAVGIGRKEKKDETPEKLSGGESYAFPWGDEFPPPPKAGNYADTTYGEASPGASHIASYKDGYAWTAPVMSFTPNRLGLYDLGGNVLEWCEDWFNEKRIDRVVRGGSWFEVLRHGNLSSTRRHARDGETAPGNRDNRIGFRIVLDTRAPASPSGAATKPASPTPAQPAAPAVGSTPLLAATKDKPFTNSLGMKFVPVPGTDILMCIHETRYKDYAAYAGENSGVEGTWKNQACNGYDITVRNEEHPVHSVNWDDAKKFCGWLSARDGLTYRLPTDEEWSNAVGIGRRETRRKDTTPLKLNQGVSDEFPWGSKWPPSESIGNYSDNSRKAKAPSGGDSQYLEGYDDGFPTTAPVMTWKPNKLGLYDLGGNVLEWCDDWYDESKTRRLLRGGSWVIWDQGSMLSSNRWPHPPDFRTSQFGIRVVIETKPQATKPATPTPTQPAAPATAAKSDFTNSLGMQFVKVPGTKVLFCIHETRKGDYAKYAAETPEVDLAWRNPDEIGIPVSAGDDHPVVRVSWNSAKAFCAWLSKKEGRTYRLPTDREWSFAGGIGRNEKEGPAPANLVNKVEGYPWGVDWPPPKDGGNLADITLKNALPSKDAMSDYNDLFPTTAPVMSFKPNKLGIFDLSGNVWELCGDWYDEKQTSHPTRGAAWNTPIEGMLKTAFRAYALPGHESTSLGFRIVLETNK